MSRRRRHVTAVGGTRLQLAGHLRERHVGRAGWPFWRRFVERLESGAPVVMPGWAVHSVHAHVRVEADGSLTPVAPVRDGVHIVDWSPTA